MIDSFKKIRDLKEKIWVSKFKIPIENQKIWFYDEMLDDNQSLKAPVCNADLTVHDSTKDALTRNLNTGDRPGNFEYSNMGFEGNNNPFL